MARPPSRSAEDKVRIVLAVLRGEVTIAEVGRSESVSQTSIANRREMRSSTAASRQSPPVGRRSQPVGTSSSPPPWAKRTWSFALWRKGGLSTRLR